jgi:endonuclease-3
VPKTIKELTELDGVARKTANVVLAGAYGINEGLAVDTHVGRISFRLGLTESTNPEVIERDLLPLFPQEEWGNVNRRMVSFGRDFCRARLPQCVRLEEVCLMQNFCPRKGVENKQKPSFSVAKSKAAIAKKRQQSSSQPVEETADEKPAKNKNIKREI